MSAVDGDACGGITGDKISLRVGIPSDHVIRRIEDTDPVAEIGLHYVARGVGPDEVPFDDVTPIREDPDAAGVEVVDDETANDRVAGVYGDAVSKASGTGTGHFD
jgi:hypothetical protein